MSDERILRGELWWSDLNPIRGLEKAQRRPLLVLSREAYNRASGTVIAAVITSQPQQAGFPLTVKLKGKIHFKEAWIKVGQIRTLSVERLGGRIGMVSAEELQRVTEALEEIIGRGT